MRSPFVPRKVLASASGALPLLIRPGKSTPPPGISGIACMSMAAPIPAAGLRAESCLFAPSPIDSLILFRNGLLQKHGTDFAIAGNVVTFFGGSIPQTGDQVVG